MSFLCEGQLGFFIEDNSVQIESFIPLWEWDIAKKKQKKKAKKDKGKEKEQEDAVERHTRNGGAFIEEVPEEAPEIRPTKNRGALIEEVEDEDA